MKRHLQIFVPFLIGPSSCPVIPKLGGAIGASLRMWEGLKQWRGVGVCSICDCDNNKSLSYITIFTQDSLMGAKPLCPSSPSSTKELQIINYIKIECKSTSHFGEAFFVPL